MSPEELLRQAAACRITTLALTDINNTSGIADWHRLADRYGVKPLAGIDFRQGCAQKFIGLARNHRGFSVLNQLLTQYLWAADADLRGRHITIPDRIPELEDVFVIYPFCTCHDRWDPASLRPWEYMGVKPRDLNRLRRSPWRRYPDRLVVLAPVTFRHRTDMQVHRLLRAMDNNTLLSKLPRSEQADEDDVLQTEAQLVGRYRDFAGVVATTRRLIEQCEPVDFAFGSNKNKKYFTGSAADDAALLRSLCEEQLSYRYRRLVPQVRQRLEHELQIISELGFASYFLINWDIVRYAQFRQFFYVGRGSGANSLVAYLLRITDVDPLELDLCFERFINPFRTSPPDFDIDFSWKDRDEVIRYVFQRYRRAHTALLATYSTLQARAVVRELGKVFGLPARAIESLQDPHQYPAEEEGLVACLYRFARRLHDMPVRLGIHASGLLISEKPLTWYTALSHPPKGFALTQFSMLEAEDLGLYKFDILSQRGLGHIKETVELIRRNRGERVDIHNVQQFKHDPRVRQLLTKARLMGCFYVESPAMRALLTKLRAQTYLDLVAASSIIRPGVSRSGMMRAYIERFHDPARAHKEAIPELLELLPETFGVMVYQEDVIRVAHAFAGLTLAEADMLRRGMSGKYRGRAEFQLVQQRFFEGCRAKGHDEAKAREVWRQIESFAGYAFAKGHSASFAVESFQSMFLKAYYPIEFMVGVINNQGGFYATEYYVHEARLAGATIHAPEINHSEVLTTVRGTDVYLGFGLIKGADIPFMQAVVDERMRQGPYSGFEDFVQRIESTPEQLQLLIRAGAFRFTGKTKKQLLWEALLQSRRSVATPSLFVEPAAALPALDEDPWDDVRDELALFGFPLRSPFALIDESCCGQTSAQHQPWLTAADLKHYLGQVVEMMGYYVTCKYTRTLRGEQMMFGTFLDRTGAFFDTTHFPDTCRRFPLRGKGCYRIRGKVVEEFGFYSLEVIQIHHVPYVMNAKQIEDMVRRRPDPVSPAAIYTLHRMVRYRLVARLPSAVQQRLQALQKKIGLCCDGFRPDTLRVVDLLVFEGSTASQATFAQQLAQVAAQYQPLLIQLEEWLHLLPTTLAIRTTMPPAGEDLIAHLQQTWLSAVDASQWVLHLVLGQTGSAEGLARVWAAVQSLSIREAAWISQLVLLMQWQGSAKWEVVSSAPLATHGAPLRQTDYIATS